MVNKEFKDHLRLNTGDAIASMFAEMIGRNQKSDQPQEVREALSEYKRLAREGDPFPFIAYQWPELLADGEWSEYSHLFEGALDDPLDPCLKLESWQRKACAASVDDSFGEVALCGSTGCGKGFIVGGIILNLIFDIYPEIRIHITSETFSHAQNNLYGEFVMWRKRMRFPKPASVLGKGTSTGERHYVTILNPKPDSGEAFSGRHGSRVVYVFDESSAAPKVWVENAIKNASFIFYLSNPRVTIHWFRDLFKPTNERSGECVGDLGKRLNLQIGGPDCTNVREKRLRKPVGPLQGIEIDGKFYNQGEVIPKEEWRKQRIIIPGQTDIGKHRATMAQAEEWKRNCFGLGLFPDEDPEFQVILSSWLERHVAYWKSIGGDIPIEAFGLDVARSEGGDQNVLACGGAIGLKEFHEWNSPTYEGTKDKVLDIAESKYGIDLKKGQHPVCIDYGGGYGAGVGEFLQKEGVWVVEFQPGGSSKWFPKNFIGCRTEAYALLGRRLSPMDFWASQPFAIPEHEFLTQELVAPLKIFPKDVLTSFRLESKKIVKEKLHGRSPDYADALTYLFYTLFELHQYYQLLLKWGTMGVLISEEGQKKAASKKGASSGGAMETSLKEDEALEDWLRRTYG